MRSLPCFLLLSGFLATLAGCQASTPVAPVNPNTVTKVTPVTKASAPPKTSVGSLYHDVEDTPLGRYMRGEMITVAPEAPARQGEIEFTCVNTGEFNIDPGGDQLLMETWCAERNPETSVVVVQVDDTIAHRVPGKHVFRILFRDAVISVMDLGNGQQEVRLHYRDPEGTYHHITLNARQHETYSYSFAELSPDTVEPIGEIRTMEVDSE